MSEHIAVVVVHGIGMQSPDFAIRFQENLTRQFAQELRPDVQEPAREIIIKPVHWAPVLQDSEDELWKRSREGGSDLHFMELRKFLIDFAADAFAYQPTSRDRTVYDSIHAVFAGTLKGLATEAGDRAPLCVIAHSLGSVIASNYFYDLQKGIGMISEPVRNQMGDTPLERGETFSHFYTLGSPIAMWSLRYADFGVPIAVPSPKLSEHHPRLEGEWINFYDEDDVCGFPLKTLNRQYSEKVKADVAVNVGGRLISWNPASHLGYWESKDIVESIAQALARAWRLSASSGEVPSS